MFSVRQKRQEMNLEALLLGVQALIHGTGSSQAEPCRVSLCVWHQSAVMNGQLAAD